MWWDFAKKKQNLNSYTTTCFVANIKKSQLVKTNKSCLSKFLGLKKK